MVVSCKTFGKSSSSISKGRSRLKHNADIDTKLIKNDGENKIVFKTIPSELELPLAPLSTPSAFINLHGHLQHNPTFNPNVSILPSSPDDSKIYMTSTDQAQTSSLLQNYQNGKIIGTIPSRPATTVLEFTKNIVEISKLPPRATVTTPLQLLEGGKGCHEIKPQLPDPILQPLPPSSTTNKTHKHHMAHLSSVDKKQSPVTNLLSLLTGPQPSSSISRHRQRKTEFGGLDSQSTRSSIRLDQSVDWQSVVKKLHESIEEEEFVKFVQSKKEQGRMAVSVSAGSPQIPPSRRKDRNQDEMEETMDHDLSSMRKLLMTGEKVNPRHQEPRPVSEKVSLPTRPRYRHFHMVKPLIQTRLHTTASSTLPQTRLKLISLKERQLIETMTAQPLSSLLKVQARMEHEQLQNHLLHTAQTRVTSLKVNDALSKMVTRDRRNARFPVFVNPVGYPRVPQQKPDLY